MNSTNTLVTRIVVLALAGLVVAGLGAASMYLLPAGGWIGTGRRCCAARARAGERFRQHRDHVDT